MTIYDLVTSQELAAYWTELAQDRAPYPCEELFPNKKKRGLSLKWLKGAKGMPVVLKTSAYDVHAVPRPRIGFDKMVTEMPYFKESKYVDEEMRQELNDVMDSNNEAAISIIMEKIFDDQIELVESAAVSRERMRSMALFTGVVSMAANGQSFTYDYGVTHKGEVSVSWSDHATSDPMEDIRKAIETIYDETGAKCTRAMCDRKTWRDLKSNDKIKKEIFVLTNGVGAISDKRLREYLMDELELDVKINSHRYKDESGKATAFMPTDTFVLFPEGDLGNTWFGTTPAESDLMSGQAANVSIVDTGVAIVSRQVVDPVQVETIVSMISLPDFPMADQVYIMDVKQGG